MSLWIGQIEEVSNGSLALVNISCAWLIHKSLRNSSPSKKNEVEIDQNFGALCPALSHAIPRNDRRSRALQYSRSALTNSSCLVEFWKVLSRFRTRIYICTCIMWLRSRYRQHEGARELLVFYMLKVRLYTKFLGLNIWCGRTSSWFSPQKTWTKSIIMSIWINNYITIFFLSIISKKLRDLVSLPSPNNNSGAVNDSQSLLSIKKKK